MKIEVVVGENNQFYFVYKMKCAMFSLEHGIVREERWKWEFQKEYLWKLPSDIKAQPV